MKRTLLFVVIVLSLVIVGCQPAAPTVAPVPVTEAVAPVTEAAVVAEAPLFVVINKSADQQYFIDVQSSFEAKAAELGATSKKFDAKLDPSLGVSLIDDAISAGAKGIAITVPDQTIGPAIAKAASAAGVVLIATDDGITDEAGNPVPFVGFNGTDMGQKVGEKAAQLLEESGWLKDSDKKVGVLMATVDTLSVAVDRTDAERVELNKVGITDDQIFAVPYLGDTLGSQDAAGPVITSQPDITNWIVVAPNDEGVLGVLNALATAGAKTENIIAVGLGAYEACKPWANNQDTGFRAALFISGLDVGATAAQTLYEAVVNGKAPAANTYAPTSIVTPENYKDIMDSVSLANCK